MIFAFLILISSSRAFAFEYSCLLHRVDFQASSDGLRQFSLPLAMMAAAPKLELTDANGKMISQCSSATVSDSGTLLTAGNCVDDCLKAAGAYSADAEGVSRIDRSKLSSVTCHIRLNGGEVADAHVLAIGDCRLKEGFNKKCDGLDYAVLKLDHSKEASACFKLSGQAVEAGTALGSVSYPTHTYRFAQREAAQDAPKGFTQQFSSGRALAPKESCYARVDREPKEQGFRKDSSSSYVIERTRAGVYLQSDVDQVDGSAGAPLIDLKTGEIRSVALLTVNNNIFVECQGGSFGLATPAILADIKKNFPQFNFETDLSCQNHALIPQNVSK